MLPRPPPSTPFPYTTLFRSKIHGGRAPWEYLPRIHVDSLVHDDRVTRLLIDTVGPDHIMLGSDMPFDMGADDPVERVEIGRASCRERVEVSGGGGRVEEEE